MLGLIEIIDTVKAISAYTLVIDGANQNYVVALGSLRNRYNSSDKPTSGFITMSNKIQREHSHELAAMEAAQRMGYGAAEYYITQHSWTLDECFGAFVMGNGKRSKLFKETIAVFQKEWDIEDDNEDENDRKTPSKKRDRDGRKKMCSVREVIAQKFAYAGGSARWMMQNTTTEIDDSIDQYLVECIRLNDLSNFSLGPGVTTCEDPFVLLRRWQKRSDSLFYGQRTCYPPCS